MRTIRIPLDGTLLTLFFIVSLVNNTALLVITFLAPIIFIVFFKQRGALLSFVFIQLRSILNPGLFSQYEGTASIVKWGMIFLLSLYLIVNCLSQLKNRKIKDVVFWTSIFGLYCILSSLYVSSYPTVATFKTISYVVPYISIILGIHSVNDGDWIKRFITPLGVLLLLSILVFRSSVGYYRNGVAFQGLFSHPNVFGVMLALFVAGFLYVEKKLEVRQIVTVAIAMFLAITSESRTGILSIVIAVIVYLLTLQMKTVVRVFLIAALSLAIVLLIMITDVTDSIYEILFKGHYDSLFYSRTNQIGQNIERFLAHPITGTGFNVPYYQGTQNWSFSFDMVVENGNIILALLADTGIIGTVLFFVAYSKLYLSGRGMLATIFFVPFIVSMGEMSFFSTNNFGIIMYFMLAVFLSDGIKNKHSQVDNVIPSGD